jgi:hypothetical protein
MAIFSAARNFFTALRNSNFSAVFKEMLLRNCMSALLQLIAKVRTKKVALPLHP